ncbi:hypothetical protein AJ79_06907 [Helicocarpus griseus UAMH5409]|uniref:Nucleoside phosphorylase domain-containing protein n=1 Tax=Helicocarpus griseus UAMH5409 TaxID=1447875 RepID=A0A2B7X820_9EURO|nr:hypothetical protein AJ79_06907 [Helicocarpus griseus UAMH5409]
MTQENHAIEIGIICALPLEARAVKALFKVHPAYEGDSEAASFGGNTNVNTSKARADRNAYTTGEIGRHHVALVHMPGMGEIPAAAVAADLKHSFEEIRLVLLVGICGGVPGGEGGGGKEEIPRKVMLGDVIVGKQVIQYGFGRQYPDGFKRKDDPENSLSRQSPEIRAFVAKLEASREELEGKTWAYLRSVFKHKLDEGMRDELMPPTYWHKHHNLDDCVSKKCSNDGEICEDPRKASCEQLKCSEGQWFMEPRQKPDIHFGTIASGNSVMRSGEERDQLAAKENIIAFDMEGAGIWDYLPCIIVKGVCDYADSHKNKKWQNYAAMTAAACTKGILELWPSKHSGRNPEDKASFASIAASLNLQEANARRAGGGCTKSFL